MHDTLIEFSPRWTNASGLEEVLRAAPSANLSSSSEVRFRIPKGCQLMTDAAVRLLALFNQLDHSTRRVLVDFEDDENVVPGDLDRIGFFESLAPGVVVLPQRPISLGATHYRNPCVRYEMSPMCQAAQ